MKSMKFGMVAIMVILAWSCGSNNRSYEAESLVSEIVADEKMAVEESMKLKDVSNSADQDYSPEDYISSSAAVVNPSDTTRKMIRTANIRFKVKDVIKATYSIENIVVQNYGFVENTNLASEVNYIQETIIKEDSTLITTYYTVYNTLILRVPNAKLDTTLKEIAQFVDFMDYRVVDAKDVTLDLLSKRLEQSRLARYDSRIRNAIDNKGKRLNDVTNAEENLLYKQEQADQAKLANLQTLDKIKFSTITLSLYQNQNIRYETVAKGKEIEQYSVPFGNRFVDALKFGWSIVVEISLFLTNIWSIILIAVVVFFGVRHFIKTGIKK